MFARKDIERDVLSDYREHGRHMRTQKEPGKTSEWPRVFVEEVKLETPEPPRPRPVESIILRGVPFRLSSRSNKTSSWSSDVTASSAGTVSRTTSIEGMSRITSQTIVEIEEAAQVVLRKLTETEKEDLAENQE